MIDILNMIALVEKGQDRLMTVKVLPKVILQRKLKIKMKMKGITSVIRALISQKWLMNLQSTSRKRYSKLPMCQTRKKW